MSDRTGETSEELVRRISIELFDEGNVDVVEELLAVDFAGHVPPTPGERHGPEGFKQLGTVVPTGFPDRIDDGENTEAWLTVDMPGLIERLGAVQEVSLQ